MGSLCSPQATRSVRRTCASASLSRPRRSRRTQTLWRRALRYDGRSGESSSFFLFLFFFWGGGVGWGGVFYCYVMLCYAVYLFGRGCPAFLGAWFEEAKRKTGTGRGPLKQVFPGSFRDSFGPSPWLGEASCHLLVFEGGEGAFQRSLGWEGKLVANSSATFLGIPLKCHQKWGAGSP